MEHNIKLRTSDETLLSFATRYGGVESLIYLAITRLVIACVVHMVSQFMVRSTSVHWVAVFRILRYLQ